MLDSTKPVSVSSELYAWIKNVDDSLAFTAFSATSSIGRPKGDAAAATSFLSRARKAGLVKLIGNKDGAFLYQIADRSVDIRTNAVRGRGGAHGHRNYPGRAVPPATAPSQPSLSEAMLELAARLEAEANPKFILASVSDAELQEELGRRLALARWNPSKDI